MTHRLNSKDFHSREHAEPTTTRINYDSNAGIDFTACIEYGAFRQPKMLRGCWEQRELQIQNEILEQKLHKHRALPNLLISLDNAFNIGTTCDAGNYSIASCLDGSTRRARGPEIMLSERLPGLLPELRPALMPAPFYNDDICGFANPNHVLLPFRIYSPANHSISAFHRFEPENHRTTTINHSTKESPQGTKPADRHPALPKSTLHRTHDATPGSTQFATPQATADSTPGPMQPAQVSSVEASSKPSEISPHVTVPNVPDSQLKISGAPTITPERINEVLKEYHSPAAGMGQYIYDQGVKHGINPAMALAFYVVESKCGTSGLAVNNKSWGNVRGHGPHGYRPFNSIQESLDDWYRLMGEVYLQKFHADKLQSVIAHYSPNSDGNNEAGYVHSVGHMVRAWNTET